MKFPIYLDSHSTTPVDPRVLKTMKPFLEEEFGNASSRFHLYGRRAAKAVEDAREMAADLIGASSAEEIIFTSGATESDNLALKGAAEMYRERGNHIITTAIEHKAVLDSCKALERKGYEVTCLKVDRQGLIDLEELRVAINDRTILISVMAANNEIGVLEDIGAIGRLAKERGVLFHTDAAQACGRIPLRVEELGIDLMSLSSHKMYGPKGVGALYVRKKNPRVRLVPLIDGGGHERGLRSGTLNVPGIAGFGAACALAKKEVPADSARLLSLRERLRKGLFDSLDSVFINGSMERRLACNLNVSFAYVEAESLLIELEKEIAVSSGAACMSANPEPSHVLKAIGVEEDLLHTSIRFGLHRFNTEEEIDFTVKRVAEAVRKIRAQSPIYGLTRGPAAAKENPAHTGREI
ncbi:MAG: IscS subfamily cysteine desulfurase [Candidatus Omnitrophica bacterium]|nr:IscS subfamily cysteine desulfurase [Candidatus Omnitrophota bacterium]